jgi:hypothetical protein
VDRLALPRHRRSFAEFARRIHRLGGSSSPRTRTARSCGCAWKFGYERLDAVEVWNGPWTPDDDAPSRPGTTCSSPTRAPATGCRPSATATRTGAAGRRPAADRRAGSTTSTGARSSPAV